MIEFDNKIKFLSFFSGSNRWREKKRSDQISSEKKEDQQKIDISTPEYKYRILIFFCKKKICLVWKLKNLFWNKWNIYWKNFLMFPKNILENWIYYYYYYSWEFSLFFVILGKKVIKIFCFCFYTKKETFQKQKNIFPKQPVFLFFFYNWKHPNKTKIGKNEWMKRLFDQ